MVSFSAVADAALATLIVLPPALMRIGVTVLDGKRVWVRVLRLLADVGLLLAVVVLASRKVLGTSALPPSVIGVVVVVVAGILVVGRLVEAGFERQSSWAAEGREGVELIRQMAAAQERNNTSACLERARASKSVERLTSRLREIEDIDARSSPHRSDPGPPMDLLIAEIERAQKQSESRILSLLQTLLDRGSRVDANPGAVPTIRVPPQAWEHIREIALRCRSAAEVCELRPDEAGRSRVRGAIADLHQILGDAEPVMMQLAGAEPGRASDLFEALVAAQEGGDLVGMLGALAPLEAMGRSPALDDLAVEQLLYALVLHIWSLRSRDEGTFEHARDAIDQLLGGMGLRRFEARPGELFNPDRHQRQARRSVGGYSGRDVVATMQPGLMRGLKIVERVRVATGE